MAAYRPNRCFNTQPPEGGWASPPMYALCQATVSTHSRLKAAGFFGVTNGKVIRSFNTQPPEGGWTRCRLICRDWQSFNTQPPEGGWRSCRLFSGCCVHVSTHSRLKAAGVANRSRNRATKGFNTQPPEGGWGTQKDNMQDCSMFQHTAA